MPETLADSSNVFTLVIRFRWSMQGSENGFVQAKISSVEAELETRSKTVLDLQGQASAAQEQQSALQAQIDKLEVRVFSCE